MLVVPNVSDAPVAVGIDDGQAHSHPVTSESPIAIVSLSAFEGILLEEERAAPCDRGRG